VTGQLQVNMSHSSCLRNMQQRRKSSHAQRSEDLENRRVCVLYRYVCVWVGKPPALVLGRRVVRADT
jgi:hypothetical protein